MHVPLCVCVFLCAPSALPLTPPILWGRTAESPPHTPILGNDKRPESRGFKKSAEIGHGSSAPLRLHQNTVKQVFWELSYPWREELPNSDDFLNPRLSGLLSFQDHMTLTRVPTSVPARNCVALFSEPTRACHQRPKAVPRAPLRNFVSTPNNHMDFCRDVKA